MSCKPIPLNYLLFRLNGLNRQEDICEENEKTEIMPL